MKVYKKPKIIKTTFCSNIVKRYTFVNNFKDSRTINYERIRNKKFSKICKFNTLVLKMIQLY